MRYCRQTIINLLLLATAATETIVSCGAFTTTTSSSISKQKPHRVGDKTSLFSETKHSSQSIHTNNDDQNDDNIEKTTTQRRTFLRNSLLLSSTALLGSTTKPHLAAASSTLSLPSDSTTTQQSLPPQPNFNCLLDLPPPASPSTVRIYLCRHGQTENNRLRLVQGSRVDPPLNNNGKSMGRRIGLALSKLDGASEGVAVPPPKVGYHSLLTRAKETAFTASQTLSRVRSDRNRFALASNNAPGSSIFVPPASAAAITTTTTSPFDENNFLLANYDNYVENNFEDSISLNPLSALGEVDFGPTVEGKSVSEMKAGMVKTWRSWSMGLVDVRPDGGGESAREVLTRISTALQTLSQTAYQNGGSIFAVSHSTYLRMLLAAITDTSLAEAALYEQKNGCINVLDIDVSGGETMTLGPKCNLLGGSFSLVEKDFKLVLPKTRLVRMNEVRHLEGVNLV